MYHEFTLTFRLREGADPDAVVERLGAAGCDDATIGIGLPGSVALAFIREASDADTALESAVADVIRALPGAVLIEASPDFVGLTDVAAIVGVSRQNMRKLMVTHQATFPSPVHEGTSSLWHLADVLAWLQERGGYAVPAGLLDISLTAGRLNHATESARQARLRKASPVAG